jgi:malate dehydrogenase (oxaloacetate-decarboxylating)
MPEEQQWLLPAGAIFPNQINNVLGFPGIFRGALDARAKLISPYMKLKAAYAIADCIDKTY